MGVAPSIVTMVHIPHHLSLQFKPTSGFQFLHLIAFFSDKKKSSTDPASPSSRGVARRNIDVASRTIHTLAAFHWHTHRQGRLLFGQQAFQGCDEDLLCHDLPDLLKAIIRKKRVDFNFVNVWVSNELWEIILV